MKLCEDCGRTIKNGFGLCAVCNQKRHDERIANIDVNSADFDVIQDALDFAMNHYPNQDLKKEFERVWKIWMTKYSCFNEVEDAA